MSNSAAHRTNGSTTSESLIRRVQRDDRVAWERLSQLYGPVVYQWAKESGLQSQDAADVMQEVFQTLTKNVGKFAQSPSSTFRGWLWTVTRNKIYDFHRRKDNQAQAAGGTEALAGFMQISEQPPAPDSDIGKDEASGIHQRALDLMKTDFEPQTWQAFWRTTIDGVSPAEVATELGLSKWSVYKARSRVLQRLREEFADLL